MIIDDVRPAAPPPWPTLLAHSAADRQHRRKTWSEDFDRYRLAPEAKVHIEVIGGERLSRLLGIDEEKATG